MERPMNSPPPYEPGFKNTGYGQSYSPNAPQSMPMHMNSEMNYRSAPPPPMQPATTTSTVVVVGGGSGLPGCPVCHNNSWGSTWGCCAWMWLICCFPIGIVCCLCMRQKKCSQCGYTIG